MPRIPRTELIDPTEVGTFHCINRCVRRAFLCGDDPISGRNYDHRKTWLQQRMQFLAAQFGLDVLGFAILSNHIHVILRNRPDVVAGWTDDDVSRRWWNLFPARKNQDGSPAEPEDHELQSLTRDEPRLVEIRSRLSNISWFMRCLVEPIARHGNREDGVTGRFWEGRYKCVPILDESALAACMAYVDLNPIRAGIADTPETSEFTSAYERIQGVEELAQKSVAADTSPGRGDWLSPLQVVETPDGIVPEIPQGRASNTGCLPMSLADYLKLLDWSGRQLRTDKAGAIPDGLAPILERLQITDAGWQQLIARFGRLFRRAAGRPASILRDSEKRGARRTSGITQGRAMFA